jgi:hypothetical protein
MTVATADLYSRDAFVTLPTLVPEGLCNYLAGYLNMLGDTGRLAPDRSAPGSWSIYGDPAFDLLLNALSAEVGERIGVALLPTYSFARIYGTGSELRRHSDRPACEHSASILLGHDADPPWPLMLEDLHGNTIAVTQTVGDALLYQGMRLVHWREPFEGQWHAQVFLHWVDETGPRADERFDRRERLGLSAVRDLPPSEEDRGTRVTAKR